MNIVKATFKFILFALLTIPVVVLQVILMQFHKGKGAYILPYFWQKCVCKIFSIKVKIIGKPHTSSQTIYISNHISYLDIPVIGSILPTSFVAKKDVASWPVFGFLSKLQQTAFISRDRADAIKGKQTLNAMLSQGKSLIIFAEGTSTDGREVLPFKSSLFAVALQENLPDLRVQSITLKMHTVNQKEIITQDDRDLYSWHRDMDTPLGTHLWRFAKSRGAEIFLNFHPPVKAHDFSDRKTLAKACHNTVSNGLEE
ncbi:MAG: 1-acyl-sn-glycerol-3-phosphate acyltransferase [Alphaproteobacteria bacterium]|nr:MAG: 1-acyl-sn-glycerol-3-phosphate acyltransferase [Alphaproteobacteria bacterium]